MFLAPEEAGAGLHLIFTVVSSVTPGHHKIAQKGKKKGQLYSSYFSEEHALRS